MSDPAELFTLKNLIMAIMTLVFLLYNNGTVATGVNAPKLLDRLESAYSLILGAHHIWGQRGGETLALL